MKAFDWVLLVFSSLWFLFNVIRIWSLLGTFEVKYRRATVSVGWTFFIPIICWLIIAYRVNG